MTIWHPSIEKEVLMAACLEKYNILGGSLAFHKISKFKLTLIRYLASLPSLASTTKCRKVYLTAYIGYRK